MADKDIDLLIEAAKKWKPNSLKAIAIVEKDGSLTAVVESGFKIDSLGDDWPARTIKWVGRLV